jgi:hypothetical protein
LPAVAAGTPGVALGVGSCGRTLPRRLRQLGAALTVRSRASSRRCGCLNGRAGR